MRRTIDAIVLALLCDSGRKAALVFGLGKRDGGPEGSGETAPPRQLEISCAYFRWGA